MDNLRSMFTFQKFTKESLLKGYDPHDINGEFQKCGDDLRCLGRQFTKALDRTFRDEAVLTELEGECQAPIDVVMLFVT